MSEHLHAVVTDDVITTVVVLDPTTAEEFRELKVYGQAELLDLAEYDPVPGIGWTRGARGWEPPPAPEPREVSE